MDIQNISNSTHNTNEDEKNSRAKEISNSFVEIFSDIFIAPILEKSIYQNEQANPFHKYLIQEYAKLFIEGMKIEDFIYEEIKNNSNDIHSINMNANNVDNADININNGCIKIYENNS